MCRVEGAINMHVQMDVLGGPEARLPLLASHIINNRISYYPVNDQLSLLSDG